MHFFKCDINFDEAKIYKKRIHNYISIDKNN